MSYLTYDLEKSFVISYDELNKQVVDLEYNKAHWPAQFSADQERELANYLQGRAIVGSWLEEVPESQVTMRKTRGAIRQLATLIDILKENQNNPVTANQGLCVTDYIYVHVAKIIDSSFYSFAYSTSHPTFKRSPASDFDHADLSQYLGQVLKNLNKGQYSNYILLEEAMSTCVTSIVAMRKTAYAAGFNG